VGSFPAYPEAVDLAFGKDCKLGDTATVHDVGVPLFAREMETWPHSESGNIRRHGRYGVYVAIQKTVVAITVHSPVRQPLRVIGSVSCVAS
jgi:hypothetical protein